MQTLSRFGIDIPEELQGVTRITSSKVLDVPSREEVFQAALSKAKVRIKLVNYIEITAYEPDEDSKKFYGSTDYGGESVTMEAGARLTVTTLTVDCFVSNVTLDRENTLTFDAQYSYEYEGNYNSVGYAEHKFRITIRNNSAQYERI